MNFDKNKAKELLLSHGFTQGCTRITIDWYTKGSQEIRLTEKGFSHWKYKMAKFNPTDYTISNISELETTIFHFRLNEVAGNRIYSKPVTLSIASENIKRRAKRNFIIRQSKINLLYLQS